MNDMSHDLARPRTPNDTGSRRRGLDAARRRHAASFFDAVVAAYVHEISERHRAARAASMPASSS